MGDRVRRMAEDADADGWRLTAAAHYKRACCYYIAGERFRFPEGRPRQRRISSAQEARLPVG